MTTATTTTDAAATQSSLSSFAPSVYDGNVQDLFYETPHAIDGVLSKELLKLSVKCRSDIEEEIHGVASLAPDESPEFRNEALARLDRELSSLPDHSPGTAAYREALALPTSYVRTDAFRVRFLRAELWDATKAALRLSRFLALGRELVGPALLERPIMLSDFSRLEEQHLKVGNGQMLPYRDAAGRPVFGWVGDFELQQGTVQARTKIMLYLFWAMSDDVETQRQGMTKVCWVGSSNEFCASLPRWENIEYDRRLMEAAPLRTAAVHLCLPDTPFFHAIRSGHAVSLGTARSRMRFHVGTETEHRYALRTYGIPVDLIPVTRTGTIKTVHFKQWLRQRRILEDLRQRGNDANTDSMVGCCPGSHDVLFRMGASLSCNPGNARFQGVIESRLAAHAAATQVEKKAITQDIIDTVQARGGTFWVWDAARSWWKRLDQASAIYARVAVSVRNSKAKRNAHQKRQQNQQRSSSSTSAFLPQDGSSKRRKLLVGEDAAAPDCGGCGPCLPGVLHGNSNNNSSNNNNAYTSQIANPSSVSLPSNNDPAWKSTLQFSNGNYAASNEPPRFFALPAHLFRVTS